MYIVTGGAGLIGSGVIWGLNRRGIDDILVVDHLGTSDKWKNLTPLKFSDYVEKDVFRDMLKRNEFAPSAIDGIIHMGACSATTERNASYLIDNNFNYTRELADFCTKNSIRFLYASSCATYGDGKRGYVDDENDLENLRPLNMYGYSKHLFDLWARREGLFDEICGCKFSNVYGCNERHKNDMRSVVCRAYEQISQNGELQLFKSYLPEYRDGEQMRDFLYIKDAVDIILFLFKHPHANGIFNVGSGRAETWNALGEAAFAAMEKPVNIKYIEMPETLRDRYQYYTKAEIGKLRALGYENEIGSLHDSVVDYIRNYRLTERFLGDEA